MTRKAVLIESSNIKGEHDLPGARADIETFLAYLKSDCGGEWYSNEITVLRKPTLRELTRELDIASRCDYSFVTFSGHGYHQKSTGVDETRVCLNENDEIAAHHLNPGSDRCTIIVDSCRKVVREQVYEKRAKAVIASFSEDSGRKGHRILFDKSVSECERGAICLFSCDHDEAADENEFGGFFSTFLVSEAESWFDSNRLILPTPYRMDEAFERARIKTTRRVPQQHPQYQGGRRRLAFPFAVHIP